MNNKLIPLICPQCGGQVNRKTYMCEYCGTMFRRDYEYNSLPEPLIRHPYVHTLGAKLRMPDEYIKMMGLKEASDFILKELAKELAEGLIPFMTVRYENDPVSMSLNTTARIRLLDPDYNLRGDHNV